MIKTNLLGKVGILITYASLFFLATYFGKAVNYLDASLFSVGLVLGMALLEIDELFLYKYYDPTEKKLATRSLLFLISLFPLGLFLLTSTGSPTGVGMFLSIISGLSLDIFTYRKDLLAFHHRFLYQLKRKITAKEHNIFTISFIAATFFYAFLVLFLGR
jgi:hypothetical protein